VPRRKEFGSRVKFAALKRATNDNGEVHCENKKCGRLLTGPGTHYDFDHDRADGLGGDNTIENCVVLCSQCHKEKTHKHDRPIMAKADRVKKKTYGIKRSGPKLPFGRGSGLKKKINGQVVKR